MKEVGMWLLLRGFFFLLTGIWHGDKSDIPRLSAAFIHTFLLG